MRIKDTEAVKEINYDLYIPVGNTTTDDPRHIDLGSLGDFVENNIKKKGTFATTEQLNSVERGLQYLGDSLDQLEVDLNTYETWTFELEDGSIINKNVLINK